MEWTSCVLREQAEEACCGTVRGCSGGQPLVHANKASVLPVVGAGGPRGGLEVALSKETTDRRDRHATELLLGVIVVGCRLDML